MRTYKHLSRGLIPRDRRNAWMIYYWDVKDEGLENAYIRRLQPILNRNGRQAHVFHDHSDWVEEACEAYFLRKAAFIVLHLDPATSTTKLIWQKALLIERDLVWLAEVFPWRDTDLMRWQRAINQMQGLITRKAQPADLIALLKQAIAQPPIIPELQINKERPSIMGRPKQTEPTATVIT